MPRQHRDELAGLQRAKRTPDAPPQWLGAEMVTFFKNSVQKRHGKLGKIAECWSALVPELLSEHCALESFSRGTLAVIVDSSAHLYELKQLLLAGLEEQLRGACASTGLRKITLKPGRWYDAAAGGGDDPQRRERRPRFRS